jgi:energy-coupling factor transporter transmembrane protein EcfT
MQHGMRIDPRLRVLYLIAVGLGVFFLRKPWEVSALLAAHVVLWLVVGLPVSSLLRRVMKLWGFALFIVGSYALVAEDPSVDHWTSVPIFGLELRLNVGGAALGVVMVLRILTVVLAAQVARAGDARAIAAGLGRLGMPRMAAASIDAVLSLFGEMGGGRGGRGDGTGGGGGGGRGKRRGAAEGDVEPVEGVWASMKRLARGDVGSLVGRMQRHIERAEQHASEAGLGAKGQPFVRDVGVIAGVSLTMLGIKAMKILPSIPFAPGHKLVLLTPLYVMATLLTRTRFGATLTGLTMGIVAFLLGDGRYGPFEILKHVAPGLVCDAMVPLITSGGRRPGPIVWSLVGGIIAVGRFATILAVTCAVQAPSAAFLILVPGLAWHTSLGVGSGYVSYHLVRALAMVAQPKPVEASPEDEPLKSPGPMTAEKKEAT